MKNQEAINKISEELIEVTNEITKKGKNNEQLSEQEMLALFLGSFIEEEVNESNRGDT